MASLAFHLEPEATTRILAQYFSLLEYGTDAKAQEAMVLKGHMRGRPKILPPIPSQ